MSTTEPVHPAIAHLLRQLDRRWRALGLPAGERAALVADIGADLNAAFREGMTPASIIGTDPVAFADEVAASLGCLAPAADGPVRQAVGTSAGYGRMLLGAGLAGLVATMIGAATVLPAAAWLSDRLQVHDGVAPLALYAVFGVFFTAAVLVGVRQALRDAARCAETVARAAVLLPASALLSLPVSVLVGVGSGFSWAAPVLFTEFAVVVAGVLAALLLSRSWALGWSVPAPATT